MTATPPLSERRVLDLIDAYGATPERWPETERTAALALIARTQNLQRAMDEALILDEMLDALPTPLPSPALRVALKDIPDQRYGIDWLAALWPFGAPWRPAAGLAAALAFGLLVGVATPSTDISTDRAAALTEEQDAPADPFTLAGLTAVGGGSENGFGLMDFSTEGEL